MSDEFFLFAGPREAHDRMKRVSDLAGAVIRLGVLTILLRLALVWGNGAPGSGFWSGLAFLCSYLFFAGIWLLLAWRIFAYLLTALGTLLWDEFVGDLIEAWWQNPDDPASRPVWRRLYEAARRNLLGALGFGTLILLLVFVSAAVVSFMTHLPEILRMRGG